MVALPQPPPKAEQAKVLASRITDHIQDGSPFAANHEVLGALSAWIYKSGHAAPDHATRPPWLDQLKVPHAPANGPDGFDAFCFLAPKTGELVIVNRGTEAARDWVLDIETAVFDNPAGLQAAIDYAKAAFVAAGGADEVKRIVCTGHSLGGGLAEAQAALLRAAANVPASIPISCAGFASAPFGRAVKTLARAKTWAIDATAIADSAHYIRGNDPIHLADKVDHRLIRVVADDLNLYEVVEQANGGGKDTFNTYSLIWMPFAHSAFLYVWFWDQAGPFHIVRRFAGAYQLYDGKTPKRLSLGRALPDAYA